MPRLPKSKQIQLWLDRLSRFAQSELRAAQFCQREQISLPSFYQWKRRLSPRVETPRRTRRRPSCPAPDQLDVGPSNGSEGFTELVIKPSPSVAQARLTNGITITLGDEPELVQLIVDRLLQHGGNSKEQGTPRPC